MKNKTILIAAIAVASIIAFIAGRMTSNRDSKERNQASLMPIGSSPGSLISGRQARDNKNNGASRSGLNANELMVRMSAITNHPSAQTRAEKWIRFVNELGPDEFEDVASNFHARGWSVFYSFEYSVLMSAWAKLDPIAALDFASEDTIPRLARIRILTARQLILRTWATNDPDAAIQWAEANYNAMAKGNPLMAGVICGIAANDPDRATALIEAMPCSREFGSTWEEYTNREILLDVADALSAQYLKQGPDVARIWASNLEGERLRGVAVSSLAQRLSYTETDLKGTVEWLLTEQSDAIKDGVGSTMYYLTKMNPKVALSYFDQFSNKACRNRALRSIIGGMSGQNKKLALDLIVNPSLDTDDLLTTLILNSQPDVMLRSGIIERVKSKKLRERRYRDSFDAWLDQDSDAAIAWANQKEVPKVIKKKLASMAESLNKKK